ncbi:MAG: RNA polymerase sigma factor [Vicinamibacterales bacterium]
MEHDKETSNSGEELRPAADAVRADMGGLRRQFWLAAALQQLGHACELADAEDALQEFLVNNVPHVCRNFAPESGSFETYLWNSFRYHCWRLGKRARARSARHVPVETTYEDGRVEIRIADERSLTPLELAERREQAQILANAVGELTSLQRGAWIAVELEGRSYVDAASRLAVPVTTLTVELHRARQRVHELINHYPRTFLGLGEIRDWAGLCKSLRLDGENSSATVGKRLWELGTPRLRAIAGGASELSPYEKSRLIHEINEVLGRQDFYSSSHVAGIPPGRFASEIRGLLRRKAGPMTARRLNKLLFRHQYERFLDKTDG